MNFVGDRGGMFVGILFVLVGVVLASFNIYLGFAVFLLPIVILMIGHPRVLLGLMLFQIFIFGYIAEIPSIQYIKYFDEPFLLLIFGQVIMYTVLKRPRTDPVFNRLMLGLGLVLVISIAVNRPRPLFAFNYMTTYFRGFLLFYAFLLWRKEGDHILALKILAAIMGLQVVLNLMWLLGINPIPPRPYFLDRFKGSFKVMTFLAYWCVLMLVLTIPFIQGFRGKIRRRALGALLILTVLLLGTFTKHVFVYLFFGIGLWGVFFIQTSAARKIALLVMLALVSAGVGVAAFTVEGLDYKTSLVWQIERLPNTMKGRAYKTTFVDAPRDYPAAWLGAGPGNAFDVIGVQYNTQYAEKFWNYIYLTYSGMQERFGEGGGSVLSLPDCGILAIYSSLGPIGWVLFYSTFLYVSIKIFIALRRGWYEDRIKATMASVVSVWGVLFVAFSLLLGCFSEHTLTSTFWVLAGILWPLKTNVEEETQSGAADEDSNGTRHPMANATRVTGPHRRV